MPRSQLKNASTRPLVEHSASSGVGKQTPRVLGAVSMSLAGFVVVVMIAFFFVLCLQKHISDTCLMRDLVYTPRPGDILCREMIYWWMRPFGHHPGMISEDGKHVYHLQRGAFQKEAVWVVQPLEEFVKGQKSLKVLHIPEEHRRDRRESFEEAEEWARAGVAFGGPFGGRAHLLCGEPNCETYALMLVQKPDYFRRSIQIWRMKRIAAEFHRVLSGRDSILDLLDGRDYFYTKHAAAKDGRIQSS